MDMICSTTQTIQNNDKLRDDLVGKAIPQKVYLNVQTGNDGYDKKVRMLLPPSFDALSTYPAIVDTYGGPGYQEVNNRWSVGWADCESFKLCHSCLLSIHLFRSCHQLQYHLHFH